MVGYQEHLVKAYLCQEPEDIKLMIPTEKAVMVTATEKVYICAIDKMFL
jgi:hypothetical protein